MDQSTNGMNPMPLRRDDRTDGATHHQVVQRTRQYIPSESTHSPYIKRLHDTLPQQFMDVGQQCVAQPPEAKKEGPGLFVVVLPNVAGDVYTATKQ